MHARIAQPCQVLALAHDVKFVEEGPQLNGSTTLTSRISAAYLDLDICAWNLRLRLPEQKLCWLSITPMSWRRAPSASESIGRIQRLLTELDAEYGTCVGGSDCIDR